MTRIRQLTPAGIEEFQDFISARRSDSAVVWPGELLTSSQCSTSLAGAGEVEAVAFATRLDLARYLHDRLGGLSREQVDGNAGLWSWLALYYWDQLTPGDRVGEPYRYILATGGGTHELWHSYRHLLASPYLVYRANPEHFSRSLLRGAVFEHGEMAEQLVSSMDLVTNPGIVEAVDTLYFDLATNNLRVGARGKGAGSVRRLVAVIRQLDLTFDLYQMSSSEIIALLPPEFDRWKAN